MPRLWSETIDEHRRAVRDAALDATAALVAERGLRAVTMSAIAARTGVGRATLYKYFPDVEAILAAWHERQIAGHLEQVQRLAHRYDQPHQRLKAVLEAYAQMQRDHHGHELAAQLHRGAHVARAQRHLAEFVRDLLAECAAAGDVRDDVAPAELANYCIHALAGAGNLPSRAAVGRLVELTLAGTRPR